MDSDTFREAAAASVEEIIQYFNTVEGRPVVSTVEPGYLRKILPAEAPLEGEAWADIQADIEEKIVPGLSHWQHPNFFAFFPCPVSYPSILGEMYSAAFSAAAFNWICSPACTELETIVLDWLAKLLGLPECFLSTGPTLGGGVIQGTASEVMHLMMVAAADKYLRTVVPEAFDPSLPETDREDALAARRGKLVALAGGSAHSATKKAARILGLRFRAVPVSAETGYALKGPALAAAIRECRSQGLEPFYLTTTLGTTDTCAVDDFASIAAELKGAAPEIWVHVDAAYAGAALVCPEHQAAAGVAHLAAFDSFNVNMHKWLLTNFDASCAYVADRRPLVAALGGHELHVYRNAFTDGGLVTDYRDWQVALGRRFRALKIWFVLRTYGRRGLQEYVRRTVRAGEAFAAALRARGGGRLFEVLTGPAFALTVFRTTGRDEDECNARTRALCEKLNASGRMWVTGTQLDGKFAIRFQTANWLTTEEHVEKAVELITQTAEGIVASN